MLRFPQARRAQFWSTNAAGGGVLPPSISRSLYWEIASFSRQPPGVRLDRLQRIDWLRTEISTSITILRRPPPRSARVAAGPSGDAR